MVITNPYQHTNLVGLQDWKGSTEAKIISGSRHGMLGKNVDLQSSIYKLKINNQFDNCS